MEVPSKQTVVAVHKKLGLDEQGVGISVQHLQEWLIAQPHLPYDFDVERLERVLLKCKGSVQKAKETLDMYYSIKNLVPEVMADRDPGSEWFRTATSLRTFLPLPKLTETQDRVTLSALLDTDPERYNAMDMLKLIFMVLDLRMCVDYWDSDIIIMDLCNVTMAHVAKYTPSMFKRVEVCGKRGMNIRLKAIHLINAPAYVDATVKVAKSLLKPKLANRIYVHRAGSETLHHYISPQVLPKEYGGEVGSIQDLWDGWKTFLLQNRDWFLKQDKLKADETKRSGKYIESGYLFGFEGSFKTLTLD